MGKRYLILDLETSGTTTFKRFCNPLDARHTITLLAIKEQGKEAQVIQNEEYSKGIDKQELFKNIKLADINCIIGQNLKFDLLYFWENTDFQEWLKNGGRVWDTQTVEYLLNGQSMGRRDLDSLAKKYGGTLKDDRIKCLYKEGYQSKDIDPELLIPYARADIENTNIVLQGQIAAAQKLQMLPLIKCYMEHYLAIVEMEFNGLYVDLERAERETGELMEEIQHVTLELNLLASPQWTDLASFNPSSGEHISYLLFGGNVPYIHDAPVLNKNDKPMHYKTGPRAGEIKTRKERITVFVPGWGLPKELTWVKKNGNYSSEDKVLTDLLKQDDAVVPEKPRDFIERLILYREKVKLLTTYYYSEELYKKTGEIKRRTGLIPLIMPQTECIHSDFKTALTRTGRLSSRNPNIQNLAPDVLGIFKSRFKDGYIVEFDYGQLEIVVQAYLSQCTNMIKDIQNNVDFHCKRLAYAENRPYDEVVELCAKSSEWKAKRKDAKTISFQKAYGAQPAKIAESSGLPIGVVEKVFQQEDQEYPEIQHFYRAIQNEMHQTRTPPDLIKMRDKETGERITRYGEYGAYATYRSITSKIYTFYERAVLTKRGKVFRYFSVPDIQDYPVQGTAADIVAAQVGKVFRALLLHRDKCLLVNEVHDSLILDVKKEHLDWTISTVCAIMENIRETFKKEFKIDFNVPIKVDHSFGRTWKEAK